jgi:uncharacterized protein YdaU (DUF1376 family)
MSEFPSLPLFTDAFLADTGHLSAQETGAYLLLIMMAWRLPECRVPDDDAKLCRWARVDKRTWQRIKPAVMEFWILEGGFWTQKRLSKERDHVSKRADVARQNGKQGGRPKSLENNNTGNPEGSSRVSQTKAPNPSPNPKEEEEKKDAVAVATGADAPSDPAAAERELFQRGREVLGQSAGGMIAGLLRAKGGNVALARAAIEQASQKNNAREYIAAASRPASNRGPPHARQDQSVHDVARALEEFTNGQPSPAPRVLALVGR